MNNIDNTLRRIMNASKNNTLSFFVGAGISKLSHAPKWSELVDSFCDELKIPKKDYYSNDDLLSIPQKYYYSINQDEKKYYEFINNCFDCASLKPNLIHKLMCHLNPKSFITTNFDDLLEKAVIQFCLSFKSVAQDSEVSNINGDRYILKLHGDLEHKNIVLKEEDYLNYSENFKLIETMLKSIFSTNTVVFIGYGLNDYNVKLILNWTKSLLKDSFNKPIFIYTDDAELDNNDLLYQQSRGLEVVDFRLCSKCDNYLETGYEERYKNVLDKIISYGKVSFASKDKYAAFDLLYELVKPLNSFKTLRIIDIKKILGNYIFINEDGVVKLRKNSYEIMTYYIGLKNKEFITTEKPIQEKFRVIDCVFLKARIRAIINNDNKILLAFDDSDFADLNCITFNYLKMEKIINSNPKNIYRRYTKAFYLAKLKRYEESLNLFTEVATEAFKDKNYVLCYLSQINMRSLAFAMESVNRSLFYYNTFKFDKQQKLEHDQIVHANIFENLPIEFKEQYDTFSNLYTVNFLYKNVYDTFIENDKLSGTINKNIIEAGITSTDRAISRINNNLHFILGNGLFIDEFIEFKITIKKTMELIIAKYAVNKQKTISAEFSMGSGNKPIYFDEIDIYCFIEFFKEKEITNLMIKNNIEDLPLENIEMVNMSIYNLFKYYDAVLSKVENPLEKISYQLKLKNCLKLLKYITISPKVVEFICGVLLKYEFREIYINDKITFIYSQISKGKVEVKRISKYVHTTFLKYIDENIKCIKNGEKFEMLCTNSSIEYWDLANILCFNNTKYISKYISDRITYIIENNLKFSLSSLFKCSNIIYKKTKTKLMNHMSKSLEESFSFDVFADLLTNGVNFKQNIINKLINHLNSVINNANNNEGIYSFPYHDPYEDLINVGYWCALGYLKHKDFDQFYGIADKFDFYFNPDEFDYKKFDVSWLMNLYPQTYETIFKNESSKVQIRQSIKQVLKNTDLEENDKQQLIKILIEYAV